MRRTVVGTAFATVVLIAAQRTHSNDFLAYYWAAAHAGSEPQAVYQPVPHNAFDKDVPPFLYPPTAILAVTPLVHLAPSAAASLWFGGSTIAAAIASFLILPRILPAGNMTPGVTTLLIVSTFFNYPFYATLLAGQINIFVALLLLGFYSRDVQGAGPRTPRGAGAGARPRSLGSAFCLAAAIAVKLYPAVFLLLLLRKRRFGDVVVVLGFLAAFVGATIVVFPPVLWLEWFTRVASAGGFGRPLPALARDLEAYNISLNGTLMRMLGPGPLAGGLAVLAGTLMGTVSLVRSRDSVQLEAKETAAIALVMICAVPVSWAHHLAMVIPLAAVAIPSLTLIPLVAACYAAVCFKWDWSFGSVMLGAIAPATVGAITLWTQTLTRRARVITSAETA